MAKVKKTAKKTAKKAKKTTKKLKRITRKSKKPAEKTEKTSYMRRSKTAHFLKRILTDNSMVEYFTKLRIMNPAAQITSNLNEPRREGGFVRLAHAREEFTAPIITKGKSVTPPLPREEKMSGSSRGKKKSPRRK